LIYLAGLTEYIVPAFRIAPYIDNKGILTKSKAVNTICNAKVSSSFVTCYSLFYLPILDINTKHGFQIPPDSVGKLKLLCVSQLLANVREVFDKLLRLVI